MHATKRRAGRRHHVSKSRLEVLRRTALARRQDAEAQEDLRGRDEDRQNNEDDDDPRETFVSLVSKALEVRGGKRATPLTRHFAISNGVAQNLGEVKEDAAALVQHLNSRLDFEILAHRAV